MNGSSANYLPKPPAERTFVFAVTVLGVVALIQVLAVVLAIAPEIRFDQTAASSLAPEAASPAADQSSVASGPSVEVIQKVNGMLAQAEQLRNSGDLEKSLEVYQEADHLMPNNPGITFFIGMTHKALGRNVEAVEYLKKTLSYPETTQNPEYSVIQQQAERALAEIDPGAAVGGSPSAAGADSTAGASAEPNAARMRDEVGIPIGSVMGVVEARLQNGEPGFKKLRIATKASVKEPIDPASLKTMVYFFEQNDQGDIMQTPSRVTSDWLSPPVDWKNGEPELLEVTYPLPIDDRGDLPPLQYYGYVVGIYYKGELQDFRAEPASLADQFPLKFNLANDGR